MPTPIGHALGAFAAGWIVAGPPRPIAGSISSDARHHQAQGGPSPAPGLKYRWWARAALLVAAGLAADLDLAFGIHSAYTHSIGAAAVAALLVAAVTREQRVLMGAAAGAAYLSHVVFDLLSQDLSVPVGVMALWPFSTQHIHSGLEVFLATDRRYWLPGFWQRNVAAVFREILVVAPLAAAAWRVRRRRLRAA